MVSLGNKNNEDTFSRQQRQHIRFCLLRPFVIDGSEPDSYGRENSEFFAIFAILDDIDNAFLIRHSAGEIVNGNIKTLGQLISQFKLEQNCGKNRDPKRTLEREMLAMQTIKKLELGCVKNGDTNRLVTSLCAYDQTARA